MLTARFTSLPTVLVLVSLFTRTTPRKHRLNKRKRKRERERERRNAVGYTSKHDSRSSSTYARVGVAALARHDLIVLRVHDGCVIDHRDDCHRHVRSHHVGVRHAEEQHQSYHMTRTHQRCNRQTFVRYASFLRLTLLQRHVRNDDFSRRKPRHLSHLSFF